MNIRIAGTANDSIVDGPGIRFTIFVQGCPHHCVGCHNPQTHAFDDGEIIDTDKLLEKITGNVLLDGVTFSGGEPFCQAEALYSLGLKIRDKGLDIITYTGYTYEYLVSHADEKNFYKELISICDYIIDGKFEEDKKDYQLNFRGSSNQRIIDCRQSLKTGKAVTTEIL